MPREYCRWAVRRSDPRPMLLSPVDAAISRPGEIADAPRASGSYRIASQEQEASREKTDELFTTHASEGIRRIRGFGRHWRPFGGARPGGRIHLQIRH